MTVPAAPDHAAQDARARLLSRLQAIADSLATRGDALALLALGSVGVDIARIDRHSDLDFFVLVRPHAKARFLVDLRWLDDAHRLAWSYRNTADGFKALMDDGVFCEFAVFTPQELPHIPYAPGRFVWRRDEVDPAWARPTRPLPQPSDPDWLLGEALSNLIVGLARHARGERLSAMRLVQVHALDRLLELLDRQGPSTPATRDPFSIERRIEQRRSELAATLSALASGYDHTPAAALALLGELERNAPVPAVVARHIRMLAAQPEQATG
jgi:hypothetical protein